MRTVRRFPHPYEDAWMEEMDNGTCRAMDMSCTSDGVFGTGDSRREAWSVLLDLYPCRPAEHGISCSTCEMQAFCRSRESGRADRP